MHTIQNVVALRKLHRKHDLINPNEHGRPTVMRLAPQYPPSKSALVPESSSQKSSNSAMHEHQHHIIMQLQARAKAERASAMQEVHGGSGCTFCKDQGRRPRKEHPCYQRTVATSQPVAISIRTDDTCGAQRCNYKGCNDMIAISPKCSKGK